MKSGILHFFLDIIHSFSTTKQNCAYLHTQRSFETFGWRKFKCEGCKYTREEKNCVVEHVIENMQVFFCLNCDDWIQQKANVFNPGWTLFGEEGYLRQDI